MSGGANNELPKLTAEWTMAVWVERSSIPAVVTMIRPIIHRRNDCYSIPSKGPTAKTSAQQMEVITFHMSSFLIKVLGVPKWWPGFKGGLKIKITFP